MENSLQDWHGDPVLLMRLRLGCGLGCRLSAEGVAGWVAKKAHTEVRSPHSTLVLKESHTCSMHIESTVPSTKRCFLPCIGILDGILMVFCYLNVFQLAPNVSH